jgi:hypothetical protein
MKKLLKDVPCSTSSFWVCFMYGSIDDDWSSVTMTTMLGFLGAAGPGQSPHERIADASAPQARPASTCPPVRRRMRAEVPIVRSRM